jgi:hypothetical protein
MATIGETRRQVKDLEHRLMVIGGELSEALKREEKAEQAIGELRRRLRRPTRATSDAAGQDLRPDPGQARTPAELMTALREYRIWAGKPSYREMAQRSGQQAAASTMCEALRSDELPGRLAIVEAIIAGCGGGDDDRRRFASAWRTLAMKERATAMVPPPPDPWAPLPGELSDETGEDGEAPGAGTNRPALRALPAKATPAGSENAVASLPNPGLKALTAETAGR